MSTIGRIFTVLNLILAAGFVVFVGTYLKEASNYRADFEAKTEELTKAQKSFDLKLKSSNTALQTAKLQLSRAESAKDTLNQQLKQEQTQNKSLETRLLAFEGDHKTMVSNLGGITTELKTTSENSKAMTAKAIAAEKAKDAALDAQAKAEASLDKANFNIKSLTKQIADQKGELAKLTQRNREQKVMLDVVKVRAPGLFTNLQPSVAGNVETVGAGGKLVTIALSSGQKHLQPGHRFAIYNGSAGYLGEATVTEIHKSGNYAFAKMTVRRDGARAPRAGDSAKTNLDNAGAGN